MNLTDVLRAMGTDLACLEERLKAETRVEYPLVGEMLGNLIDGGGKRLRPLLLFLAGKPFDYDLERLLPAAVGVELLHTASLIHDDTVDRAMLRRGQPTLNSLIGTNTVILFGDYIFARSAMMAAATMNPQVVQVFASTLADICDGELMELFSSHQIHQSVDDYRRRIYGKTASLFAGSAEMGAILAGANDQEVDILRRFGVSIGMAFQIVDDVLDLRQNTADIGKPAGLDLRQGTVTLPTMLFLENGGNDHEKDFIRELFNGDTHNDADFETAVDVIRSSGAIEHALEIAEAYVVEAHELLAAVPAGEGRDMLAVLADLSLSRTF